VPYSVTKSSSQWMWSLSRQVQGFRYKRPRQPALQMMI